MKWDQYRSVMEQYVIKTDDMATEDAYFMATHMPFSQLEVIEGGQTATPPEYMSENEVFEKLINNPENLHRLIIVRGNNGTGKSHLIRYLKARFENSDSTVYNKNTEQLIFLRRLNNSVRGVFSQLLEQKVIQDPEVEEKIKKFVDSSDSQDEAEFKTKIWLSYVGAVSSDKSNKVYRTAECKELEQFLLDSRVQEHLMREDGAISRCYRVITMPSDQVLKETRIFTEEDFAVRQMLKAVAKVGNEEAKSFVQTLKSNDEEVTKLINYLNHFTSQVVQRCADISSESTKSVFEKLRKDLKRQGKNLTLFIEDFTGFTGIDSELITVLSTEHGGDYADLCRVTAIIGITDGYYGQFKDNFKDRVTHQINVTENSYGNEEFLIHMAVRYLNAIYCDPNKIQAWYKEGALLDQIPISDFTPPCPWESEKIGDKVATLYPFNKQALMTLYSNLTVKTPRMFLRDIIKAQLKEYFDGKKYGDEWKFPLNPNSVPMGNAPHSSAIDRQEQFSEDDRQRLKNLFALWGNGSANGLQNESGTIYLGGIHKAFLVDIGLSEFAGIGQLQTVSSHSAPTPQNFTTATQEENHVEQETKPSHPSTTVARESAEHRKYRRFQEDIDGWYTTNQVLQYPDYKTWLRNFICGSGPYSGAINWQDIGIPAYIAAERLSDIGVIYIEGQANPGNAEKAIIKVDRSPESRDALLALLKHEHAKGWDFSDSAFYQQKLITWLERRKTAIINKVCAIEDPQEKPAIYDWCLALQYLKAKIMGKPVDISTPLKAVISLFNEMPNESTIERPTQEWQGLISLVKNEKNNFDSGFQLLRLSANTTMGTIQRARSSNVYLFRTDELVVAAERLISLNWNINEILPENIEKNLLNNPAILLKKLYPRVKHVVEAEEKHIVDTIHKVEPYVGKLSQESLVDALSAIQNLFLLFFQYGIYVNSKLQERFEDISPIEETQKILLIISRLSETQKKDFIFRFSVYSANDIETISNLLKDFQEIERIAQKQQQNAEQQSKVTTGNTELDACAEVAAQEMAKRCEQLLAMEVDDAAG